MNFKKSIVPFLLVLLIEMTACSPAQKLAETSTPLPIPAATITSMPDLSPTPTEWLPYDPNNSDRSCGAFEAKISKNETNGLSQEELAKKLFEIYLGHFKSPDMGSRCGLENFKVDGAPLDKRIEFLAAEQQVDYVARVIYAVQIKEEPSDWIAGNGEFSSDGWIVRKSLIVGVAKVGEVYVLKLIGTGP